MGSIHEIQEEYIKRCLEQGPASTSPGKGDILGSLSQFNDPPRPAAVLVPLVKVPIPGSTPSWHLLYTRRTDLVQDHKGQVSFPGGRSDLTDLTPENTALREAYEEIGLHPSVVRVLGRLPQFLTITNYLVTPIVGAFSWPYEFTLQPAEVSRVFTIPLTWLAEPAHSQVRQRSLPPDFPTPPQSRQVNVIYFDQYEGELLWGVTAGVTIDLLRKLKLIKKPGAGKRTSASL